MNMDQVKCPGFLRSFCSTPRQAHSRHSRHSHIDFVIFRDSCWILLAFEGMIGDDRGCTWLVPDRRVS